MEQDLTSTYAMIDDVIRALGIDPEATRGKKAGQWAMTKGSAKVWIDVWHIKQNDVPKPYFQVMSPVMRLPTADKFEAFFRELLEINDKLFGVAFTIFNGWAWLKHIREVEGLDRSEVDSMLLRVGNYADRYDDMLKEKYGEAPVTSPPAPGAPGTPGQA